MLKCSVFDDDGKMNPSVTHWNDIIYYANCHNVRTATHFICTLANFPEQIRNMFCKCSLIVLMHDTKHQSVYLHLKLYIIEFRFLISFQLFYTQFLICMKFTFSLQNLTHHNFDMTFLSCR
ncbi:hypothetical protein Wxf_02771 [Wolbachia endosymbiont of Armadillidium vulgare]|nr:hypothetical protein Wxf_01103 [Wolbachia endosymbiont of Armadillidium vulgare]OJH32673.1 hypothetical protein Wxf_02117 [Wolbachia endosymbiont of Armadillidium vulgare]OJH33295.1 hypothetical protein Wxf_02771 [Wolbachia endosymbiont of Armadillidium vulgare]